MEAPSPRSRCAPALEREGSPPHRGKRSRPSSPLTGGRNRREMLRPGALPRRARRIEQDPFIAPGPIAILLPDGVNQRVPPGRPAAEASTGFDPGYAKRSALEWRRRAAQRWWKRFDQAHGSDLRWAMGRWTSPRCFPECAMPVIPRRSCLCGKASATSSLKNKPCGWDIVAGTESYLTEIFDPVSVLCCASSRVVRAFHWPSVWKELGVELGRPPEIEHTFAREGHEVSRAARFRDRVAESAIGV